MSLKGIQKYSHCIRGTYTLRPPSQEEAQRNSMAGLDADQFYEASQTGGAVPFRFLAELKMTQGGQLLFDAYYTALKTVCHSMLEQLENYIRKNNIDAAQETKKVVVINNTLSIRIRVFIRHGDDHKVDIEVIFFIDGSEKGETDFEKVCRSSGVVTVAKLAEALSAPLAQADQAIQANAKMN